MAARGLGSVNAPHQRPERSTGRDYTMASTFVWLLFECLLTLDQEVELLWGQGVTGASVLFFSNRYLPLLCSAWWTPWWRYTWSFEELLGGIGEYLLFVPVAAFSAMRAYALAGRWKRTRGIVVFLLSTSPAIMALVLAPWLRITPHPHDGCKLTYQAPVLLMEIGTYTIAATSVVARSLIKTHTCLSMLGIVSTRFFLVLADLVVLCVTWSATYRHRHKGGHPRISDILFRDGMHDAVRMPAVAQLLLNSFYLISILLPPEIFDAQDLNSIASMYVQPATSILITHFLLDLQQASRRTMHLPAMNTQNWEKVMGSVVLVSPEREEDCDELALDVPP
ncbi:hypothetical protein LXA43DRAFT_1031287, partial [Ganoderma leucocontextum]